MDHECFDVLGRWELDRGPQELAYDFWWHLGYDTMVSSEWGTPDMFEDGLIPEKILGSEYGHRLHFWDLLKRRHLQEIDLGKEYQLVFELRPAHDPTKAYGFAGVVLCLKDLSSSVFLWHRDGDRWAITKVISIPAEPAEPDQLPPILKGFKACTNSLYSAVDGQLYPDGITGWMVKVNAKPEGGIELDEDFFLPWPEGYLPHQVRLQGGDASSDSYCYP